jgi:hypothetical protein
VALPGVSRKLTEGSPSMLKVLRFHAWLIFSKRSLSARNSVFESASLRSCNASIRGLCARHCKRFRSSLDDVIRPRVRRSAAGSR